MGTTRDEALYETIDRQFGYARGILRRHSEGSSKNAPLLLPYRWRVILEIARSRILASGSRKKKIRLPFSKNMNCSINIAGFYEELDKSPFTSVRHDFKSWFSLDDEIVIPSDCIAVSFCRNVHVVELQRRRTMGSR